VIHTIDGLFVDHRTFHP